MTIQFLPLSSAHLPEIWQIEQHAHSHPWSKNMIDDVTSRGACHQVMMVNGRLVGYYYAQHIVGEVTLLNIAISPNEQGKGYGKHLAQHFLAQCEQGKAESAWLEVRESNQRAFHLYQQLGFNEIDRRFNYYPTAQGKEDAIIMSYFFFA